MIQNRGGVLNAPNSEQVPVLNDLAEMHEGCFGTASRGHSEQGPVLNRVSEQARKRSPHLKKPPVFEGHLLGHIMLAHVMSCNTIVNMQ